jgi:small subunit ribosomal protein S18
MSNSVTNYRTRLGEAPSRSRADMPPTETFGGERKPLAASCEARAGGTREQTACRFCRRRIKYIDYKDIETLQKLLTNRGKIYSRKRSGNCAKCQRKAKKAIKRARYMALLPFTA